MKKGHSHVILSESEESQVHHCAKVVAEILSESEE
jgi:hypothetical protein